MPHSPTSVRGRKERPKAVSGLLYRNGLCQILMVGSWSKLLTWRIGLRVVRVVGSSLELHLVLLTLGRRGVMGMAFLMCCSSQLHCCHLYLSHRVVHFPLCKIWFRVTNFSLGAILHCSILLKALTSKLLQVIILKKVDKVLAKGSTEPSTGGAGFYYNVFVVPKCNGDS